MRGSEQVLDDTTEATRAVVQRLLDAFGRADVDAIMAEMADDVVFESTEAPDGRRHQGQADVRRVWEQVFATPGARFTTEALLPHGERAVALWRYSWGGGETGAGHVRGVDVMTVRRGKVVEKLSYVKG
ncbi:nuclear transport factor 2 family protein [Geodermatophilus sp. SYSU D00742]